MASLSKSARTKFVAGLHLEKRTENTHITAAALLADLAICAKRGYALDNEEFMVGMLAIAVPVTDRFGRYVAALAFHGPSQRLSIDILEADKGILLSGAEKLNASLFT